MSGDARRLDASSHAERGEATVGTWLAALQPAPPPALVARLTELLMPYLDWPQSRVSDACMAAGEQRLSALLRSGSTERVTALDLLAVDALVTYAFEVAADTPDQIESRAARAMQRISALPHTSDA
ncbi:MAG: hypothetical protein IPP90_18255 [Gemmatimonadaceae bacterium]|nr:hypothetical protein [Gemmatimonadaceae bacterium]